MEFYNSIKLY